MELKCCLILQTKIKKDKMNYIYDSFLSPLEQSDKTIKIYRWYIEIVSTISIKSNIVLSNLLNTLTNGRVIILDFYDNITANLALVRLQDQISTILNGTVIIIPVIDTSSYYTSDTFFKYLIIN
jgi:hypothetical protein